MDLGREYPPELDLKQVIFVHRHGQRTPIWPVYSERLYPYLWRDCHLSPYLHSFYASLEPLVSETEHTPEHPGHEKPPHFAQVRWESVVQPETPPSLSTLESYKHLQTAYEAQKKAPGSCFYGQLTDTGKRNMMSIGSHLRALYVDRLRFLSSQLKASDVYVRSTDYSRTIESVQYLLGGLYPAKTRSPKESLAIHIRPFAKETMYPHPNCPSLLLDTKRFREKFLTTNSDETKAAFDKIQHLGLPDTQAENKNAVHRVYDFLACLDGHGISLPWKVGKDTLRDFENLAVKQWCNVYEEELVTKRAIGRFLPEIKDKMMPVVNETKGAVQLAIFSGHDSTISPLVSAFKVFNGEYPGFAANVAFELFKEKRSPQHFARMLYNGNAVQVPACQPQGNHRAGDPTLCTLSAFLARIDAMTPKDYELDCRSPVKVSNDWDD